MTARAIVMENKNGSCTVVTDEGEFRSIRGHFTPGQVISLPENRWKVNRMALMVASLLLLLAVSAVWKTMLPPAVASYVTLDLNPAVELALDSDNRVLGVRPLNGDEPLTEGLELTGIPLETAVDRIIKNAVSKKVLSSEGDVVVSTVTLENNKDLTKLNLLVRKTVENSLKSKGVSARVLVGQASPEARKKADSMGISTGRYLLYQDAAKKGLTVKPEDLKKKNITTIEKDRKIKIKDDLRVEADNKASGTKELETGDRSRNHPKEGTVHNSKAEKGRSKPVTPPKIKSQTEDKKTNGEEQKDDGNNKSTEKNEGKNQESNVPDYKKSVVILKQGENQLQFFQDLQNNQAEILEGTVNKDGQRLSPETINP